MIFDGGLYIRFKGSVGYTLNFDTVAIRFDKIEHNYGKSGTLKVVLWAVADYTGGTSWSGTRMGEYRLETIDSGWNYTDYSVTVPRSSPNPGSYTMIMELEGYGDGGFVMCDHRVFDEKRTISRDAKLIGTVGYAFHGNSVELRVEKISHNFSGKTGTLMLVLWACSNPESNNQWTGYNLAESRLDPLEKGYSYTGIVRTVKCSRPPSGRYYMILQLKSHDGGWVGQNHRQFNGLASF